MFPVSLIDIEETFVRGSKPSTHYVVHIIILIERVIILMENPITRALYKMSTKGSLKGSLKHLESHNEILISLIFLYIFFTHCNLPYYTFILFCICFLMAKHEYLNEIFSKRNV